jgi:hypothetical protein
MDDLDAQEVRRRAWEAIDSIAETKARLAERAERRQWAGSESRVRQQPPSPPARQRPEGRDCEAVWITSLIDARIAGLRSEIADGVGQAIAVIRKEEGEVTKRAIAAAIEALRTECKGMIANTQGEILRALTGGEIGARLDEISAGLRHLDRCLERMAKSDAVLGRLARGDIELLPN